MYTADSKRRLYPTCLCYHGCVGRRVDALVFREHINDVKAHIRQLKNAGYRFVLPSEYRRWQAGEVVYDEPIICIHWDDCLGSIDMIVPWLIAEGIPSGIAIITRRLGYIDPEDGFASWKQVRAWVATGLVEVMSHTHNMHHLTLIQKDGVVDVAPVLEGPCWIDNGDVVYRAPDDPRWYWDFTHVDAITLGIPLYGTDPYDATTPIITTLTLTPKATGSVTLLRLWMALSKPSGAGYDVQVQIHNGSTLVWSGIITPKNYETRSQWVEREFHTITLDTPFFVNEGAMTTLRFTTLNAGPGVALLYGLSTRDDGQFRAVTNCKGLYPAGSQGLPDRYWQYIDYQAGDRWPVIPCLILGFGTGRAATMAEYTSYVGADCEKAAYQVETYLNANWTEVDLVNNGSNARLYQPFGWRNPERISVKFPLAGNFRVEYLRITVGPAELFSGGDGWRDDTTHDDDPVPSDIAYMNRALDRSYPATFDLLLADEEQGEFVAPLTESSPDIGYIPPEQEFKRWHRFALGEDPETGESQGDLQWVGEEYDEETGELILPSAGTYYYFRPQPTEDNPDPLYQYIWSPDDLGKTVVWLYYFLGDWTSIGQAAIWRIAKNLACDVTPFDTRPGAYLKIEPINGGPTVGEEQVTRWGLRCVRAGRRSTPIPAPRPDQLIYPFGSYNGSEGVVIQQRPGFKDISAELKATFIASGLRKGYTIQGIRNVANGEIREPDLRQTEWALGRWLVYGDQALAVSNNNLAAYSGYLLPDVQHHGVEWQVSMEADPLGNATIKSKPVTLDYVAFDAWAFNGQASAGTAAIVQYACNDGGTYGGQTYPNDRAWLQARGIKCLLILNNNLGTGEPDPDIGYDVIWHPDTWIPMIVSTAVTYQWDGITCNLEAIPAESRAQATLFYKQLARAMHAAGKMLHITAPAPTGTAYDADWWVRWCDHGELIKYVDGMKIMSYTESGPGSAPGPAAPNWFWEAVYDRLRRIIPLKYQSRILCGVRSFGHMWAKDDNPDFEADYVTYHTGIQNALSYGARLDIDSTEFGWSNRSYTCWFGTPLTVERGQVEAERSGFGGIGMWKLDDGDMEEFFPDARQIGRFEDMSYLNTQFPPQISFGSSGGPAFKTLTQTAQNGREVRQSLWTMPLYEFDASLAIQSQEEYNLVRALYMVSRGPQRSFRYKDWSDFRFEDDLIGVGDGERVNFQAARAYAAGGEVMYRAITKLVAGTITIWVNGVQDTSALYDANTGGIGFFTAPPASAEIRLRGEFDVHVRFMSDKFPADIISWGDGAYLSPGTVQLREVRET